MGYFDALAQGGLLLLDPMRFAFLFLGTLLGMALGAIPGLGSTVGLAILLPFMFGMEPVAAMALMIGVMAVTTTADSIPAVLFAVPGTSSAAATILDGYPMCKKGEAGRAMGAAFSASLLGGVIGAIILSASIPIARPLLRQWLSPEYFMLCFLGVILVGGFAGKRPLKGIFTGAFGLALSVVGGAPNVVHYRFVFDQLYLYNGIPLLVVALGIFALPELADLFIKGTKIADVPQVRGGLMRGYKDTLQNWWLVIRSSLIGAWIGFAPGIGASGASWMAYAHAVSTIKDGQFGKGDVRGVIAPETANNAVKGGDLIPTLMFGIPGSGAHALLLAAFIILGITPGPAMVEKNLSLLFSIVWSLALANIMAAALCSCLIRPIAKVSVLKVHYLVPFILLFVLIGVYQSTYNWGDLIGLFIFGLMGWTMKRLGWPRPPLLVGFVLGGLAEKYLWLSYLRYDWTWLYRPWVLGIFAMTVLSLYFIMRKPKAKEARLEEREVS